MVVTVNPCSVNDYIVSAQPDDLVIEFGDPDITSQAYGMTQVPNCGYQEAIKVLNLPQFATHNAAEKTFTITNSGDPSDIGEYTIIVQLEISVPNNVSKSSFTKQTGEIQMKIFI